MTALEWFTIYLETAGSGRLGNTWQCPAHRDAQPSLSVSGTENGHVLIHCHAGCSHRAVLGALGLAEGVLFEAPPWSPEKTLRAQLIKPRFAPMEAGGRGSGSGRTKRGTPVKVTHHVYIPERVRLERRRFANGDKELRWESRQEGTPDWNYGLNGRSLADLPLYDQQQVVIGVAAGEDIIVVESESSVDELVRAGFYATTWAGGAASPHLHRLREVLAGGHVVLIPDQDAAGRRCAEEIKRALSSTTSLRVLEAAQGEDARDLLTRVGAPVLRSMIANHRPGG